MANKENLTPFTSEQSREEAVKNGAKGGIKSGEVRRARRDIRKALEALLEKDYQDKSGNVMSGTEAIALKQMEKAMKGDTRAFEIIRDTIGQKPIERVQVTEIDQADIDEVEAMVLGAEEENVDKSASS